MLRLGSLLVAASALMLACATIPRKSPSTISQLNDRRIDARAETDLININTASAERLEQLPGVGEAIARRIVEHRNQYGPFRRAEHLMMVRGISESKVRALRSVIVV